MNTDPQQIRAQVDVVLADLPHTAPISQAMSPAPFMLEEQATAYDAMLAMAGYVGEQFLLQLKAFWCAFLNVINICDCFFGSINKRNGSFFGKGGKRQF